MNFNNTEVLAAFEVTVQWFGLAFVLYFIFEVFGLVFKLFRSFTET